jgi:hypothetical protein
VINCEIFDLSVARAADGKSSNSRRPARRLTIEGAIQL